MKNRMKTHLKSALAGLVLLAGLGLGSVVQADHSAAQQSAAQPEVIVHLAWQRVGAPISMEG